MVCVCVEPGSGGTDGGARGKPHTRPHIAHHAPLQCAQWLLAAGCSKKRLGLSGQEPPEHGSAHSRMTVLFLGMQSIGWDEQNWMPAGVSSQETCPA